MTDRPVTLDSLRADIAGMLEMEASEVGDDVDLMDLGLDSMRAMNLVLLWEEREVPLDFADLAEAMTLAGLWRIARERLG